jgi:hypothetical protein
MRIWHQGGVCLFEYGYGECATNGREVIEKYLQRITSFEMIEECLDWHSRAGEDRRSTKNVLVDSDEVPIHDLAPNGLLSEV